MTNIKYASYEGVESGAHIETGNDGWYAVVVTGKLSRFRTVECPTLERATEVFAASVRVIQYNESAS